MPTFPAAFSDYSFRKKFTVAASKIDSDLTGYPVVFDLNDTDIQDGLARADGYDIRVSDSGGTAVPYDVDSAGRIFTRDGIHTFFCWPVAIYSATHNHTLLGTKPIKDSADRRICLFDHDTNLIETADVTFSTSTADDHDNCVVTERSDGKYVVFGANHLSSGAPDLEYKIATTAGDISAWGATKTVTDFATGGAQSYTQITRLSAESSGQKFLLISRKAQSQWVYATSTDDCDTFTTAANFWSGSSFPYLQMFSEGVDRVDFFVTDDHPTSDNLDVWHFYYDGSWRNSDGTLINGDGLIPAGGFDETDLNSSCDVMNLTGSGSPLAPLCWLAGCGYNNAGEPTAVLTKYIDGDGTSAEFHYAEYDSGWSTEKITDASQISTSTEIFYTGGGCIDGSKAKGVILSVGLAGASEMQAWEDTGTGWAKTVDITASTSGTHFRPYEVQYNPGQFVWCAGKFYTHYEPIPLKANSGIFCYPPLAPASRGTALLDLSSSSDTDFYVYYGYASATDGRDPASIWSNNKMADLFSDSASGQNWEYQDPTNSLTYNNFEGVLEVSTGTLGAEVPLRSLTRDSNYTLEPRLRGPVMDLSGLAGLTVEVFVEWDGSGTDEHAVLSNLTGTANLAAGFLLRLEPSDNSAEIFVDVQQAGRMSGSTAASSVPADTPTYITFTFNGDVSGATKLYAGINDGAWTELDTDPGTDTTRTTVGSAFFDIFHWLIADHMRGTIGEPRIWTEAKPEAWGKATYRNFFDAAFLSSGAEESGSSYSAALTGTAAASIDEDDLVSGLKTVILTLTGDTFVTGTTSEDGIAAGSNSDRTGANKWNALVKTSLDNTNVVISTTTVANDTATITLPAYGTFDADETETVTWTIPPGSLTTSADPIVASPSFTITAVTPPPSASLSGTAAAAITDVDVAAGSKTVVLILSNDTFVTGPTSEDAIAGGSNSNRSGATKWNTLVKGDLNNADVVISTTTVANDTATITLPVYGTFDSDETETVTWTIPAASLTTSADPLVAGSFQIRDADAVGGEGLTVNASGAISGSLSGPASG